MIYIIHDYDSHYWLAKLPDGRWISAEDYASYDPIFQTATKIRIEPLHSATVQAILEAEIPEGYTPFLRTDIHRPLGSKQLTKLGYVLALEKGIWPDPGRLPIGGFMWGEGGSIWEASGLPFLNGFRAELCTWDGSVEFEGRNFDHQVSSECGFDLYKFFKIR